MSQPDRDVLGSAGQLPPGQDWADSARIQHYGPVPRFKSESWKFLVFGATADGQETRLVMDEILALPTREVTADLHCARGWSAANLQWSGIPAAELAALVPPAEDVTQVVAWGEYGYSANMRLADFLAPDTLIATHLDGEVLPPERGYPLRLVVPHLYAWKGPKWLRAIEFRTDSKRGFWEERGYHFTADPWLEQRYSYLE